MRSAKCKRHGPCAAESGTNVLPKGPRSPLQQLPLCDKGSFSGLTAPSDEGAVSEADWGRESLKAFTSLENTGKDGTFSLPQSLRDSSLIRGSLVRLQQPSERKRSLICWILLQPNYENPHQKAAASCSGFFAGFLWVRFGSAPHPGGSGRSRGPGRRSPPPPRDPASASGSRRPCW